jgi:hypothetical protein
MTPTESPTAPGGREPDEEALQLEIPEDEGNVVDDAEGDDTVLPQRYDVTSFGADYDVDGFVKRLSRGDVFIPHFQREYVWTQPEASRFVESLLLGLPVPGVILAREPDTNKLLVIDGQQRLKTLQFFYGGYFNPRPDDTARRVFKLIKVQSRYEGKTYEQLEESDRIQLDNAIIHATIVKQDAPAEDDTSIYHIFERLNTAGRRLFSHEIRLAIFYGSLIKELTELNDFEPWREIFGRKNKRLKDQELILRFLALFHDHGKYGRPMAEFLNLFVKRNRNPSPERMGEFKTLFESTISIARTALGPRAFRPQKAFNAAIYDAVMVGISRRLQKGSIAEPNALKTAYEQLLIDKEFAASTSRATSDNASVASRLERATAAFAEVR